MKEMSMSRILVTGSLIRMEPTRGLEPRTYRLQGAQSALTMTSTSYFNVYSDHSGGHSGASGRKFASHVVSRRPHQDCDLQIDRHSHHGTTCVTTRARSAV
jgi:hypothetical protein